MKQIALSSDVWRTLWRDSTAVLSRDGNRLRFISAILIVATVSLPYLLLFQVRELLLSAEGLTDNGAALISACFAAFLLLLTVFLTLPLVSGLFYLAGRMENGEETLLSDVFYAFANGAAYRRGLCAGIWLAIPPAVLFAVPRTMVAGLAGFAGNQPLRWILVALAAVVADFLSVILLLGGFRRGGAVFRPERGQKRFGHGARRVGLWYWVHFLPHLILSVLSLLIYLIADILPRMLISYFRLWRMLAEPVNTDDVSIGG